MNVIETRSVSVTYRPILAKPRPVLESINFELKSGEIIGLIGHNGAGKTTLLRAILGMIIPDNGTIRVRGHDPVKHRNTIIQRTGVILDAERDIPARWTVSEFLNYTSILHKLNSSQQKTRTNAFFEMFEMNPYRNTPITALSRGTRQKVILMSVLLPNPDLLIFDEAFLGLDTVTSETLQHFIQDKVREEGLSAILTTHQLGILERISTRLLILQSGCLVANETLVTLIEKVGKQAIIIRFKEITVQAAQILEKAGCFVDQAQGIVIIQANTDKLNMVFTLAFQQNLIFSGMSEQVGIEEISKLFTQRTNNHA